MSDHVGCQTMSCDLGCSQEDARAECFRCGLGTCGGCSSKIKYLCFGVRRICRDCQDEMLRFGDMKRQTKCHASYFGKRNP